MLSQHCGFILCIGSVVLGILIIDAIFITCLVYSNVVFKDKCSNDRLQHCTAAYPDSSSHDYWWCMNRAAAAYSSNCTWQLICDAIGITLSVFGCAFTFGLLISPIIIWFEKDDLPQWNPPQVELSSSTEANNGTSNPGSPLLHPITSASSSYV